MSPSRRTVVGERRHRARLQDEPKQTISVGLLSNSDLLLHPFHLLQFFGDLDHTVHDWPKIFCSDGQREDGREMEDSRSGFHPLEASTGHGAHLDERIPEIWICSERLFGSCRIQQQRNNTSKKKKIKKKNKIITINHVCTKQAGGGDRDDQQGLT